MTDPDELQADIRLKERLIDHLTTERDQLRAILREAVAPGGIGEHEFSRPGGWRARALQLLKGHK